MTLDRFQPPTNREQNPRDDESPECPDCGGEMEVLDSGEAVCVRCDEIALRNSGSPMRWFEKEEE